MPIHLRALPEHRVTVFTHSGSVPDEGFHSFYGSAYEEKRFDIPVDNLVDLRETDSSSRTGEALRVLAESIRPYMDDVDSKPRVAVIAPRALTLWGEQRAGGRMSTLSRGER